MDLFGRSWRLIFLVNIPIGLVTVDLIGVGLATLRALGRRACAAMPLILAAVYATIMHGRSAAPAASTVLDSRWPVRRPRAGGRPRHRNRPAVHERGGSSAMPSSTSCQTNATEGWP
jgi:hypothetical protein